MTTTLDANNIRGADSYIDNSDFDDWSDSAEDSDSYELDDEHRVDDEDWEIAEKDFTKQYNRLRQHVAVKSGTARGTSSSINQANTVASLPAVNQPRSATTSHSKSRTMDQLTALSKYSSRISRIDIPYTMGVGVNRKGPSSYANMKDKSDRATNEQVLDPRTRLILFKMIGRGLIHEINGCANVYHALTPESKHLALKIYKTSILVFKDRDKYVTGEFRFRRGYSRRNPRKMVRLWAEKEMRNLKRLKTAGIRCPDVFEVRENVLVMEFLGDPEGWASPRLKDAEIPAHSCSDLYIELLLAVRTMYQQCKLVHADLSEYNILYHQQHLYIIDVSQSVEHDHPSAFDFLRNDLTNIDDFFGRLGVKCLGLRQSFKFITADGLDESTLHKWLTDPPLLDDETIDPSETATGSAAQQHEDSVFLASYIPRTLSEVYDPERDVAAVNRGEGRNLIYANTIGIVERPPAGDITASDPRAQPEQEPEQSGSEDEGGSSDSGSSFQERKPRGHRHEDRDAKQERKKAVKAEARERRKNKMPKAEKKRAIKRSKGGG